jgi:DNA mismatch repair protein MutS2
LKELEIIHGSGTGRLRGAVRAHLREHALVRGFSPGGPGRGGDGVTVVEIGAAAAPGNGRKAPKKRRAEA